MLGTAPGTVQCQTQTPTGRQVSRVSVKQLSSKGLALATAAQHESQGALAANCILGSIKHSIARQSKEVTPAIFSVCVTSSLLCAVLGTQSKNIKIFENIHWKATKLVKRLEGMSCEDR